MDTIRSQLKGLWTFSRDQTMATRILIPLRFYLGAFYVQTGLNKLLKGDLGAGYLPDVVAFAEASLERAPAWYSFFLEAVVLDYPLVFTLMVAWGETLLGFALLFGVTVRLAGFLGAFMALNFALGSGRPLWLPSFDVTLALALLTLGAARCGRVYGIDLFLAKRFPGLRLG